MTHANQVPLRLPETMLRRDIGPYVRSLREYYGLSQQDVAARLHLRLKYVQAIEQSQFEALPGAVYAKGYIHTYAEFLGLDANQVVEKCFSDEPKQPAQEYFIPDAARKGALPQIPKRWLGLALAAVVMFGLYHVVSAPLPESTVVSPEEAFAEVPPEMLASMRRAVMANPENSGCLTVADPLACFYASELTRQWVIAAPPPSYARLAKEHQQPAKKKKKP